MTGISSEIVGLVYQLLPGFIAASVFYALTSYLKPPPFERIVQALIFTVIVKVFVIGVREISLIIGSSGWLLGSWTSDGELATSVFIALLLGLFLSLCVNNDFPLSRLRKWKKNSDLKITQKTLHPSEWYSAFEQWEGYVALHLTGGRRLYGWVTQYPDNPEAGHFLVKEASWLLDDGTEAPLHAVEGLLIRSSDVELVEFMKPAGELSISSEELERVQSILTSAQSERTKDNGDELPKATSK